MSDKKKIILINPPLFFSNGIPSSLDVSVPPLGIMYLASYINEKSNKFQVEIIDVSGEKISLLEINDLIKEKNPFVVGISAMTPQLQGAVELARFLKQKDSRKFKIFLGGPHISADTDFINRYKDIFDFAITGEAEKTLLESIEKLGKGKSIPKLQRGEVITDLDQIPYPDRNLIKKERYHQRESMMFSRGCPYQCYYCSRPAIDKKVRYRSVENIIGEIKLFCTGPYKNIDFQDDSFTFNRSRVIDFCKEVIKENLGLRWTCNTRIDLVDEELINYMGKAGCYLMHFGIESGNEKVRKEIVNKGNFSNKQIGQTFKICHKAGIKVGGYFMLGHPGETKKDIEDTKKLIFESKVDLLGLSIPTPFPGSKLYNIAKSRGIIDEKIVDRFAEKKLGEGYAGIYPVLISENLSKEYIFSVMKGINRKFYLNFRTLLSKLKEDILSPVKIIRDVDDMFSLIKKGVSSRKPYIEIKEEEKKE